ncbi:MAG TPA: SRPBCC domain-containing protein [Methylocystis sp.]|nr:SRPBCC domain-containing protein [Methylocystis sp.]
MIRIETRMEIDAAPSRIWSILTDFSAYPEWNPFIVSLTGRPLVGERVVARIAPSGSPAMTFRPVLLAVEPERELRWLGTLLSARLFAGEHRFQLEPLAQGKTSFTHGECFNGLLAPLLMRGPRLQATREGFLAMNAALKRRAEAP